ncbi:MAG: peptidase S10 [Anaerolineales bacterium]|nr:peptidase S10 [Anaerolineales bacterium]
MAEEKPALSKAEGKPEEKKDDKPKAVDNLVTTKHSIRIGGKTVKYSVTAGTMVLKEESADREKEAEGEKPKAQIFFVAYTKDGVGDTSKRPLTFSFNGGPGSSSVWLHLGVLGPRRVLLANDGELPKPPYQLKDNEFSILDETDLVFIDPMNTGYSRPVTGEKAKEWHGFKKDIESVGDFIRLYATRYNRWLSPKFLIGESYGTTRASGLSGYLQERHGMYLNGLMLISAVLDFTTIDFNLNNDLPFIMFLPGYTATAWYHDALKPHKPLQDWLKEAEEFALGDYAKALLKGDSLTKEERADIVKRTSYFTGVSEQFIERSNLRINDQHYFKELLRERGLTVGRLDSRLIGRDRLGVTEHAEYDPLLTNIMGPYTAAFYDYIRRELKFESDLPYEILSGFVHPWSYKEFENAYVNVTETLRAAMTYNPYLKVYVANGYYDLGTPYFATEYTFNHLGLDESLRGNITMGYYEAGHMMYIHIPSLKQMKKDLANFIKESQ